MKNSPFDPSFDEVPAVDKAESADGHPHTLGVEYTDDETLVSIESPGADEEFGEDPDVEVHDDEAFGAYNSDV
jgi:FKBP-type peptidyl-prolyl cis-trans isomerase 2